MKATLPPLLPQERWLRASFLAFFGLAFVFLAVHSALPSIPCGFRSLTGLPCAMCGGTRSALALLGGDFNQALHLNALALPVLAGMFLGALISCIELLRGRALHDWSACQNSLGKFLPLSILLLLGWWIPHVVIALKTPKLELIDLKNPIAAKAAAWLGK
jgi:hypothetical protein